MYPPGQIRSKGSVKRLYAYVEYPDPKTVAELVQRIEQDHQFLFGKLAILGVAQSIPVRVEFEGENEVLDKYAAHFLKVWTEILPAALKSFAYGRAAFEKTYTIDPDTRLAFIDDLDYIPPEDSRMIINDGHFCGIRAKHRGNYVDIPPWKSWWCAIDADAKNRWGVSRYAGAPLEVWKRRQAHEVNEEVWYQKFALGHGIMKAPHEYPPGMKSPYSQTDDDGQKKDPFDDAEKVIDDIRSGGTAILSSAVDPTTKTPLWDYSPPTTRQDANPLEARRQTLDTAALRSLGVPERALTQDSQVGSYSLAEAHQLILYSTAESFLAQIVESFNAYVIRPTVALSYPTNPPKIYAVFETFEQRRKVDIVRELVERLIGPPTPSPFVTHQVIDLRQLLLQAKLPISSDLDARLEAVKQAATQPPAAPGGPFAFSLGPNPNPEPPKRIGNEDDIAGRANRETFPLLAEMTQRLRDADPGNPAPIDGSSGFL